MVYEELDGLWNRDFLEKLKKKTETKFDSLSCVGRLKQSFFSQFLKLIELLLVKVIVTVNIIIAIIISYYYYYRHCHLYY